DVAKPGLARRIPKCGCDQRRSQSHGIRAKNSGAISNVETLGRKRSGSVAPFRSSNFATRWRARRHPHLLRAVVAMVLPECPVAYTNRNRRVVKCLLDQIDRDSYEPDRCA